MDVLIRDLLLPAAMIGLMFGMGLTLSVGDFRRIAQAPTATVLGTFLQLVAMPAVGMALALAFGLPPILAAGIVIAAACPGGMFSNMYVHLARGHTALSITLTASATMVTLFTLPLWVRGLLATVGGAGDAIEVPVLRTAAELGGLTVLPVLVGMAAHTRWRETATLEKWLTRTSALVIVVAMTVDGFRQPELPVADFQRSFPPALLLVLAGVVLGLGAPALFRLPMRDAITIAVELVVKNGLLGIVLARRSLDFEAVIPILVFGTIQGPIGILLLVGWRFLARRGVVGGPEGAGEGADEITQAPEPAQISPNSPST